ncbi:hypothetical protein NEMIN01_1404 [Nematocida minor]|uniref:uncharacterized protein n=1 Tax=Nematocida minor TaxID=1912983 RepID=UPI00221EFBA2|nr:uncharacterized protein NEMIN01_1404 [Nematocida minor]KAI5191196.1 hypothetical protein NEMIN01_1404 [Nematocida minor]
MRILKLLLLLKMVKASGSEFNESSATEGVSVEFKDSSMSSSAGAPISISSSQEVGNPSHALQPETVPESKSGRITRSLIFPYSKADIRRRKINRLKKNAIKRAKKLSNKVTRGKVGNGSLGVNEPSGEAVTRKLKKRDIVSEENEPSGEADMDDELEGSENPAEDEDKNDLNLSAEKREESVEPRQNDPSPSIEERSNGNSSAVEQENKLNSKTPKEDAEKEEKTEDILPSKPNDSLEEEQPALSSAINSEFIFGNSSNIFTQGGSSSSGKVHQSSCNITRKTKLLKKFKHVDRNERAYFYLDKNDEIEAVSINEMLEALGYCGTPEKSDSEGSIKSTLEGLINVTEELDDLADLLCDRSIFICLPKTKKVFRAILKKTLTTSEIVLKFVNKIGRSLQDTKSKRTERHRK